MFTDILDKISLFCYRVRGCARVLTEDDNILSKTLCDDEITFYKNLVKTVKTSTRNGNMFLRRFVFDCYRSTVLPTNYHLINFKQRYLDNLMEKINNCKNNIYGGNLEKIIIRAISKSVKEN